jgi:deazaflavin-dependent oxidoreductase (nitroreductase family)
MARWFGVVVGGAAVTVAAFAIAFLVGMRRKSPAVLGAVRRTNRAVINPRQLASAGTPGAAASVIHHRGRRSGREYATPVGANPIDDGFLIALPYGTQADWLRNVLAAGTATIDHEGGTYPVIAPELVPIAELADRFSATDRRLFRLFAIDQCLRVRHDDATVASTT